MVVDTYRARARRRPLRDLRLETTVSQTNTAQILPAGPDLQLSSLIAFTGSCALEPETAGELFLDALVTQTNTAEILDSATLALDSLIPFSATCALVEDTPELELRSLVAQTNTARIASQLRLQSTISQTNRATLRGNLALRAPISMTNSAQLTGTLPADVVLVPSTIDHTGATCVITNFVGDPTKNLKAFIDSVPQGSEIRFPVTAPAAKYRMDTGIVLDGLTAGGYQFNFNGATFIQPMAGTILDGVITGGTTLSSARATFLPHITGTPVTGAGIPANTTVTYVSAHTVTLSNASTNGTGKTVNVNPGFYTGFFPAFWSVTHSNNMSWRNGTLLGGHINAGTSEQGFASDLSQGYELISCLDFEINNVTIRQTFGDFVYCANGTGGQAAILTRGRIHHCTFNKSGRQGIPFQGADGVEVDHCFIDGVARSMHDFEPNSFNQFVLNLHIHHNFYGAHRLLFLAASGGYRVCPIRNIDFHDNLATSAFNMDFRCQRLVKAASNVPLPACTYDNGPANDGVGASLEANANGALPVRDGIQLEVNDLVCEKNEANRATKGIYRVAALGSATSKWRLVRWTGADTKDRLLGQTAFIESGTLNAHRGFQFGADSPPALSLWRLGIDGLSIFEKPAGGAYLPALTRGNFRFVNNTTTASYSIGVAQPAIMGLAFLDGIEIRGNTMPVANQNVRAAQLTTCTNYVIEDNTMLTPAGLPSSGQFYADTASDPGIRPLHGLLNGVTFDSDSGASAATLAAQELALNRFPKRPIVRLVCDPGQAPSQYTGAVNRFYPYADIVIMPADSTALKAYTNGATTVALRNAAIAAYTARFNTYLNTFEDTAAMFEAGNELGGGWTYDFQNLGKEVGQQLVADMVTSAHDAIKARGKRSMVCLWENNWGTNLCGAGTNKDESPQQFSARLPTTMRHEVDYLMISWYPTQCGGRPSNNIPVADIKAELESLHLLYPNARIAFGEVGLPNAVNDTTLPSAQSIALYYYQLGPKLRLPYYDGGYFWWYAQQDAVPVSKPMWSTLATAMGEPEQLPFPVGFAPGAGLPTKVGSGFTQTYPELDAMKAYGAQCVRITYGWDAADPTHNGSFVANTALRDVITYCNTAIDLPVILTLSFSGTAPWQNHIYSYIPQYASSAVGCAAFFDGTPGKKLLALELGNEPNHDKADEDVLADDKGDRYAQILIRVFDPLFGNVRAVNPGLDVIIGGLGGERETGNGVSSFQFTQDIHGNHTVAGNVINVSLLSHYDGWNCLGGDTEVITRNGIRKIADLAGTEQEVLTKSGNHVAWRSAQFRSFGVQPTVKLTLRRYGATKQISATPTHRWFVQEGAKSHERLTSNLQVGDELASCFGRTIASTVPSPQGIGHGIVFGDGTRWANPLRPSEVTLCGEKDAELLKWFPNNSTRVRPGIGVTVCNLPRAWKSLPDMNESNNYLYGWLLGYLAADGTVGKNGRAYLSSANRAHLEFARGVAARLSIPTGSIARRDGESFGKPGTVWHLGFAVGAIPQDDFLIAAHRLRANPRRRRPVNWRVEAIEEGETQEVFCAVEPVTGTFTLAENLLTGNSHPYSYYTLPEDDLDGGWDNLNNIMAWFQTTYGETPPLWVTEMGHPTDEHDDGTSNPLFLSDCFDSAQSLQSAVKLLDQSGWDVRCFTWFSFMNNNKPPGPGVGHDNHFGIVLYDADFVGIVPKPHLAAAFARVAARGNYS